MKALLVLPEMPDSCFKCECRRFYVSLSGKISYTCNAPAPMGKPGGHVDDFETCRPDWCPLQPMPRRFEDADRNVVDYKLGWNDAIDEIIEGSGEDATEM